jgi:hypothetical protein
MMFRKVDIPGLQAALVVGDDFVAPRIFSRFCSGRNKSG